MAINKMTLIKMTFHTSRKVYYGEYNNNKFNKEIYEKEFSERWSKVDSYNALEKILML